MKLLSKVILLLLLVILVVFSFWKLEIMPYGLNWDEAAYGYNAYSILKTGRDEFGISFPLFLKSFGDYKPALLSYLQIPFIQLLGLNSVALRIPSVVFALISVVSWLHIQRKLCLYKTNSHTHTHTHTSWLQLIGTAFFATSPLLLHYSRAAMDPILSFGLLLLGFCLFIQSQNLQRWLGVFFLILSVYTYNSARLFIPLFLLTYALNFEQFLFKPSRSDITRITQYAGVLLVATGFITLTLFSNIGNRAHAVFVLQQPIVEKTTNESLYRATLLHIPAVRVFSNKVITSIYLVSKNYLSHLDPMFLFFDTQLSPRHGFSKHGNLLLLTAPLIIIGFFRLRWNEKKDIFFLSWLFLSILPAAVTDDVPHSGRILQALPAFIYFITRGVEELLHLSEKYRASSWIGRQAAPSIMFVLATGLLLNSALYMVDLYRYFPEESYSSWQGDDQDAMRTLLELKKTSKNIIVSDVVIENYIFYALYAKVDPLFIQYWHDQNISLLSHENLSIGKVDACTLLKENALVISEQDFSNLVVSKTPNKTVPMYSQQLIGMNRFEKAPTLGYIYDTSNITTVEKDVLITACTLKQQSEEPAAESR